MRDCVPLKYGDSCGGKYGMAALNESDVFAFFFGGRELPCDVLWADWNHTQHIPV